MVQVTPFKGTRLAEMALQNRNFNAQQQQLGVQNQQRDQQLQQGQDRLDMAAQQLGMEKNDLARQVFLESVSVTEGPEQAAALMEQFLGFPIDDQAKMALSQLPTDAFNRSGRELGVREQQLVPQKVRELTQLRDQGGLTPEEYYKAVRIALGTAPRAVGNSNITITDGSAGVTADDVGQTVGTIEGSKDAAKAAVDIANDIYTKQIPALRKQLANYDQAIDALDNGASSGAISNLFPSFRASTIELENATNKLGLDVIGMVTFGALSKGELDLALSVAVPRNLPEAELKQYLIEKKTAQEKYATELATMGRFLSVPGRTLNDYLTMMEQAGEIEYENDTPQSPQGNSGQSRRIRLDAQGNIVQ
jgi:hypothetical protein